MGIKNGAPNIIYRIRRGLYHKKAKNFNIYVDGELMRYKGMIDENLSKTNAEEAIACSSFQYLKRMVNSIEDLLGGRAKFVKVFMDGARVNNKETKRSEFHFDACLIRTLFKRLCALQHYSVDDLQYGESELQMYLTRDKSKELNVFLTSDSDMISICYGHTPTVEFIDDPERKFNSQTDTVMPIQTILQTINDGNFIYPSNMKITDSCMWVNCNREGLAIGFDFIIDRMIYEPKIFRTFIAFCQTDFTENLFPESMIDGILMADCEDKRYVNTLSNANDIAAILQVLGLRGGGQIKRDRKSLLSKFDSDAIEKAAAMYIEYIETGFMPNEKMPRIDMSLASRHYLYAMRQQDDCFTLKSLQLWAKSCSLSEAIDNMHLYLGTLVRKNLNVKKRKLEQATDDDDGIKSYI